MADAKESSNADLIAIYDCIVIKVQDLCIQKGTLPYYQRHYITSVLQNNENAVKFL